MLHFISEIISTIITCIFGVIIILMALIIYGCIVIPICVTNFIREELERR